MIQRPPVLKALQAELVGIAFSWEAGTGYYVTIPEESDAAQQVVDELRPFFENNSIEKIGHNLKYDLKVLSNYALKVTGPLYDTLIAHYLINPDRRHSMDLLASSYLNYEPQSITELIGKKGKNQGSMREVPLAQQCEYAVEDADITLQLKHHFDQELAAAENGKLFQEVELPLVEVLATMEQEGINLNTVFLNEFEVKLAQDINRLEQKSFNKLEKNLI